MTKFTAARHPHQAKPDEAGCNMKNPDYCADVKASLYKKGGPQDLALAKLIRRAYKGNQRSAPDEQGLCRVAGPLVGFFPTGDGHYLMAVLVDIEMTKTPGKAKSFGKHLVLLVDDQGEQWEYYSPNPIGLLEPLPGQSDVKQKRADIVTFLVLDEKSGELVWFWRWLGFKQKPLVSAVLSRVSWPDLAKTTLPPTAGRIPNDNGLNYHSPTKKKSASRSSSPVREEDKAKKSKSKSKSKEKKEKKSHKSKKAEKAEKKQRRKEKKAAKKATASLEERASAVAAERASLEAQLAELQRQVAAITEA